MSTPLNARNMTVTLKRIEVCDLMLACTTIATMTNAATHDPSNYKKWDDLHEKLVSFLDEFDKSQGY